jgi:beta-1,4-mannosyltransferase
MRAAVVVLGDLGRSPRMLFHARALAAEHVDVDLVGTSGAALPSFISGNPRITVHTILDSASRGHAARSRVGYVVAAVLRGVRLLASLTALLLWRVPRPDVILVQNPPGAPTLAVAWLAARVRSARLVVDWHNTTSAMLAMRLGASHVLVRAIGWYEGAFGRAANVNLFVSSHMKDALGARWRFGGIVFRDQPADTFAPSAGEARERVRADLVARFGRSEEREPVLLISPTSWTADEKLTCCSTRSSNTNAAVEHDAEAGGLPPVLALITGSGPMKRAFEDRVSRDAARPRDDPHRLAGSRGLSARDGCGRSRDVLPHVRLRPRPADEDRRHVRRGHPRVRVRLRAVPAGSRPAGRQRRPVHHRGGLLRAPLRAVARLP